MDAYRPDSPAIVPDLLATEQLVGVTFHALHIPISPDKVTQSQRDVGMRVPINYVTGPGVSLTSACFSDDLFEVGPAQQCFSNLLAIGYRRFIINLYWDTSRLTWSLCPVQLPSSADAALTPSSQTGSTVFSTSASAVLISSTLTVMNKLRKNDLVGLRSVEAIPQVVARQTSDTSTSTESGNGGTSTSISTTSSSTYLSTSGTTPTPLPGSGGNRYQIGPYTCDASLGLQNITSVLSDYLETTENSLNATLNYLIFNLHSATTYEDPTGVAPTPSGTELPGTGNYVSDLLNDPLSPYIYTPVSLATQRENLNSSWYDVTYEYRPLDQYLDLHRSASGIISTENGWPNEAFVELEKAQRVLAGFGTVDQQLRSYDFSADADKIFSEGQLSNQINTTFNSDGVITEGCIATSDITLSSQTNASWAVSSSNGTPLSDNILYIESATLSSCGISPVLNTTLGSTADNDTAPYIAYVQAEIWSWASNEPGNSTSELSSNNHCAALNYTNGGRWQAADCGDAHHGACRVNELPFNWTITSQGGAYDEMDSACDDNTFSVPRTALENANLEQAVSDWLAKNDDDASSVLFWVNFNDADITGCWVTGINSTCPYSASSSSDLSREVIVPTVAAVIVFVLAIGIIFIKCAANRQKSRSARRRGDGGWDYEGVPS